MKLSEAQRAAVERWGQDACCVAGPGSGKTTVLVERFAWLVGQGLDAETILAITFTEKAATQIKARLVQRFAGDGARRRAMERAPVSTIHAFCLGLLREHALKAGVDPEFALLDEREAEAEQAAAMETVLDRMAAERAAEFAAWAEAWPATDLARALRSVYEALRMGGGAKRALSRMAEFDAGRAVEAVAAELNGMLDSSPAAGTEAQKRRVAALRAWLEAREATPALEWLCAFKTDKRGLKAGHPLYDGKERLEGRVEAAKSECAGAMFLAERAAARQALLEFDEEYQRRKRARAALDFGDLEEKARELLKGDAAVRQATQERYAAILMDELQDTNPVQWAIVDLVRREGRFFAVGDINQSIYGFRYAAPEQFSAYERGVAEKGGEVDRLEANYRSREEILAAVSGITVEQACPGVERHRLTAGREYPPGRAPFVEVQRVETKEGNEEALWIARRLRELHGTAVGEPPRPARFSDMAILARTTKLFDGLEEALERFGIPAIVKRGRNFYEAPESLDLTNWLRVLENPRHEIALYGLLRSPFFGVSDEELMRLRLAGRRAPAEAEEVIGRARALREEIPADRILARLIDERGYLRRQGPRARANVDKFLRVLREMDAAAPGDLMGHLEKIGELRATGKEPNAPEVDARDAVEILSVHTAKGLEFPIVALASMERGVGGADQPVCWSAKNGLGMKWRIPGTGQNVADPVYTAWQSATGEREGGEENRLLYVAMTRAEERLILSWTDRKRGAPWPKLVESGLGIEWPGETNTAVERGAVRVTRLEGEPELLAPVAAEAAGAPVEVRRLEEEAQAPAGVAVTSLSVFDACPRRYFLQAAVRWPQPAPEGGEGGRALGTEVHEFLGGLREEASAEARALAGAFEASELGERARRAARSERELDFLAEIEGTLVRGQIDLWFEERGRGVVVDYKTDRHWSEARLRAYTLQLRLYAAALERTRGRAPEEAWLFSLRDGGARRVEVGREGRAEALRVLAEWREAERAGAFPLRETEECRWCPYVAGACPAEAPE